MPSDLIPGAERVVCDTCGISFIRARRKLAAAQRRRFCSTACRDAPSSAETEAAVEAVRANHRAADRFARGGQIFPRTR